MAQRPVVWRGVYFVSKGTPTKIRCKRYNKPPSEGGEYVATIPPATVFGPVDQWEHTQKYTTVKVGASWINVWRANGLGSEQGVEFAAKIMAPEDPDWPEGGIWV